MKIDSLFKIAISKKDLEIKIETLKSTLFDPMDQLYKKRKIITSFYLLAKAEGEAEILRSLSNIIWQYTDKLNTISLTVDDLKDLQRIMYTRYDPFLPTYRNIDGLLLELIVQNKCELISEGVLLGQNHDLGLWSRAKDKKYSFAPAILQHQLMAVGLIMNRIFKQTERSVDSADFVLFQKCFPESPYIPFLSERYFEKRRLVKKIAPYTFAIHNKKSQLFQMEKIIGNKSLLDLIRIQFSGKPVFVDIWATWCGPCVAEFEYSDSLSAFLDKKGIALLYISIDYPRASENWTRDIIKYNLVGYHYFASNGFLDGLSELLKDDKITIPRYLLFDKNGNMVAKNLLSRPSDTESLYAEILNKIKVK